MIIMDGRRGLLLVVPFWTSRLLGLCLAVSVSYTCLIGCGGASADDDVISPPGVLIEPPRRAPVNPLPKHPGKGVGPTNEDDDDDDGDPPSFGCPANNLPLELLV